ncbi:hypothetical protein KOR42_50910 [Thalassoglobus neptunius]|uniref:Cytochrome c domain-containing protein n=1 Tax=Thalassoglobus neptunius TaxID=1938619 RepID=A0A5C5VPM5_9PLAN|nr:hypothetical protein [Thalassoglobus neptunius]TWT39885.1 hypothetical protein KOR42_50910 [Thalassoglobus neptunius]
MMKLFVTFLAAVLLAASLLGPPANSKETQKRETASNPKSDAAPDRLRESGHSSFVSPHTSPIAVRNGLVYVVNTPSDTVDVIDSQSKSIVRRIPVGIDPVSIGVRPDGKEVWIANHVSDSVSVIDSDHDSPTFLHVIATIQQFDPKTRATTFDEPMGIAFATNEKAYVALSSENQIAVVDVKQRRITKRLAIAAQDPRAISVRNGRLYVIPFESNNKTQLSGGSKENIDGDLVTFDAWEHSILHNNVLSLGHVVDIVKHPDVPDRDLFVFDTKTDELIDSVDTLGTLLYGLTVDSSGRVFIAQTDARNHINGRAGTKKHSLKELDNRAFLNQITQVQFTDKGASRKEIIDLEPLPPEHPSPGEALATPYAIEISGDDSTLVVTAAASDKVVTIDAKSGKVMGRVAVDAVPRGIALDATADGSLSQAWVLNAVANTVSLIDLNNPTTPTVVQTIELADPTPPAVRRGRIAFETASASMTETYSCASCHPDGHTDQLLWVLKTPIVTGGDQIMPRSTMPIRGLRDTEPFHWDGIPGDPYGGNNSANIHGSDEPTSIHGDVISAARHLIDGALAGTMAVVGDETINNEGKAGLLSAAQRDEMSEFLLSVPYPPSQKRPYDNVVTDRAKRGFQLFHIDGDLDPTKPQANVCGNCHRMPFLVSTNTPGTGMDAPTWRGAYDRFLILPQGRLNILEFDFYERIAQQGIPEKEMWRFSWGGRERFNPVWDMVLEGSTGYSGAFARQLTLNERSAQDEQMHDLLIALESSAAEEAIILEGHGLLLTDRGSEELSLRYQSAANGKHYVPVHLDGKAFSREELIEMADSGELIVTLTGYHGERSDSAHPQPAIWTLGPIEKQRGPQKFPKLYPGKTEMIVSGRHLDQDAHVFLNGRRVRGDVELLKDERVRIALESLPDPGMQLMQLQNPDGKLSNDFIVQVSVEEPKSVNPDSKVLSDILNRNGWDRLLGVWGDPDTGGEKLKMIYSWKIEGRVIETRSFEPKKQSVGLMAVNGQSGDVFDVSADATGSSTLGTWKFESDGNAVLQVVYATGEGQQGTLNIHYQLVDDDTLHLTFEFPEPFHIKLIRMKPTKSHKKELRK